MLTERLIRDSLITNYLKSKTHPNPIRSILTKTIN